MYEIFFLDQVRHAFSPELGWRLWTKLLKHLSASREYRILNIH